MRVVLGQDMIVIKKEMILGLLGGGGYAVLRHGHGHGHGHVLTVRWGFHEKMTKHRIL